MKSKIETAALLLLINGGSVSKFDVAKACGCTPISAQRKLSSIYKAGVMRIAAWVKSGDRNIPVYRADGGRDVAPPKPKSNADRCKKKYKTSAVEYLVKQRAHRLKKKLDEGKIGYETNPYRELYRIAVQRSDRVCD